MEKGKQYAKYDVEDVFMFLDDVGDGKIDVSQVGDAIRIMGHNPTKAEIRYLYRNLNFRQRITKEEFFPILREAERYRKTETAEDYIEGLKLFDPNETGRIHAIELRHILTGVGEKLTDDEVNVLLADEVDSNGYVNYKNFVRKIMNG